MGQYYPSMPITLTEAKQIAYSLAIHDVNIVSTLDKRKRTSTYYYKTKTVHLNPRHGVYILLHELAHHTCRQQGHTKLFRGHYLRLVKLELGEEWADRLARAFTSVGLSWETSNKIPVLRKGIY